MKHLTEYIIEAKEIQSIWKRNANNALETGQIIDRIQELFLTMEPMSLDNKTEMRKLFNKFIEKMPFGNKTQNLNVLAKYGLATESSLRLFILGSHDELEKHKIKIDWINNWNETKAEKELKKWKESDEYAQTKDDESAEERDIVIYDRWHVETHIVKDFVGKRGKISDHQVNMMRMEFGKDFGVKYYDCYTILAKNYFGHEEELQNRADSQLGYDDPNEFN